MSRSFKNYIVNEAYHKDPKGYMASILRNAKAGLERFLKNEKIVNYEIYEDYKGLVSLRDNDTNEIKILEYDAKNNTWEIINSYSDD